MEESSRGKWNRASTAAPGTHDTLRRNVIGETIKDFKIVARLGKGGMGEVWAAEQQIIKTKVAIKLVLGDVSSDKHQVERFFNEAIAWAAERRSAAGAAMRKRAAPRSACSRFARASIAGIRRISVPSSGPCTTRARIAAKASACFRCRTGPSWTCGSTFMCNGCPSSPCTSRSHVP